MPDTTQYLTEEKFQEIKKELEYLKTEKRREVAEHLEYSKRLGDLSENAEYHEAREEQAGVEDRINHLESVINKAVIVDGQHGDVVGVGDTVRVKKVGDGEVKVYKIVGSEEADSAQGKVSNMSPLGSALIGKKKGESFSFKTPKGQATYVLESID
jgi:transcription elongation factor GreA